MPEIPAPPQFLPAVSPCASRTVTLKNMWWGFLWGTSLGVLTGLVLGRPALEA